MKRLKSALLIIALILLFSVLFYFFPPSKIIGKLPFINQFYNNTTIEIVSQNSKSKVWIDGKEYGETPTTVQNLPEGEYMVEIQRVATTDSFYQKQSFNIELSRNTTARVDIEIGPNSMVQGTILYYTPIKVTEKKRGDLTLTSNVESPKIFIDKEFVSSAPITNLTLTDGQYEIKVSSTGYEEINLPVLIREGYQLNLKTYHFPIPVMFEEAE